MLWKSLALVACFLTIASATRALAQTREIQIHPLSFQPDYFSHEYYIGSGDPYCVNDVNCTFVAPVQLPDGATIERLSLFAIDDAIGSVIVTLYRSPWRQELNLQTLATTQTVAEFPWVQAAHDDSIDDPVVDNGTYIYYARVELQARQDHKLKMVTVRYTDSVTGVSPEEPTSQLEPAVGYPNPFGEHTSVRFSLSKTEAVEVRVYDAKGRLVSTIHSGALGSGTHDLPWNGRDDSGKRVGNGVYYVRVTTGQRELVSKVIRVE